MRLDVWSALPPAPSGVADYVAESLSELSRHADVVCRVEDPLGVDPAIARAFALREASLASTADLGLLHLGNSPSQGFVWRAARSTAGVLVLHEWSLADVVRHETLARGDSRGWRREARLGRGATGSFFARLVEEGWGGDLLAVFFPMNEALIRRARGVVTLSRSVAERVRATSSRVPVLALPSHFLPPPIIADRRAARRALGLPEERFLITCPGLATRAKRIDVAVAALGRLVSVGIDAGLVVAGGDPDGLAVGLAREAGVASRTLVLGRLPEEGFFRALVASDVVLGLRFPSHGETSAAAIRALGLGACVVLTAGSETALDLPEGTCVCVTPGRSELEEVVAVLLALARHPEWRSAIGTAAAGHIKRHHSVRGTVGLLADFLGEVLEAPPLPASAPPSRSAAPLACREMGGIADLLEEAELAALEVGLDPSLVSLDAIVHSLVGGLL